MIIYISYSKLHFEVMPRYKNYSFVGSLMFGIHSKDSRVRANYGKVGHIFSIHNQQMCVVDQLCIATFSVPSDNL